MQYYPPVKPQRPDCITRCLCCCCPNAGCTQSFGRWPFLLKFCCCIIPLTILSLAILTVVVLLIYLNVGLYHPSATALSTKSSIDSGGNANVTSFQFDSHTIGFTPRNTPATKLLILLPEFKFKSEAYVPLATKIASSGPVAVAIVQPSLNFPPFGYGSVYDLLHDSSFSNYTIYYGGHGLGGATVVGFATSKSAEQQRVKGLVLMGTSASVLKNFSGGGVLSVYGSLDPTISDTDKSILSATGSSSVVTISGGNHVQFASIDGTWKSDEVATISEDEQQQQTATAIVGFVNKE